MYLIVDLKRNFRAIWSLRENNKRTSELETSAASRSGEMGQREKGMPSEIQFKDAVRLNQS